LFDSAGGLLHDNQGSVSQPTALRLAYEPRCQSAALLACP